jgi:GMP synthase-like glutamine amidotransferase
MAILYVDPEHDRVALDPDEGARHSARVEAAMERIASTAGQDCQVERYGSVTPGRVSELAPMALVIGGCTTDWAEYEMTAFDGLGAVIREATVPILGICAGHQLIGYAHGIGWGPLGPLQRGERDADPRFAPGIRKERGFLPAQVDVSCALFRNLTPTPVFYQSHYWQLLGVPSGFKRRAKTGWSPIQAIERLDRPVFGVQFHPERFDAAHEDGERVLRNFFAIVRADRRG